MPVDPVIPTNVTGTWHLDALSPDGGIGPQVGEGILQGYLQDDQLYVDLNPARVDDNVVVDGTYLVFGGPAGGASWKGTWIWSTISGPQRTGTFEASR